MENRQEQSDKENIAVEVQSSPTLNSGTKGQPIAVMEPQIQPQE